MFYLQCRQMRFDRNVIEQETWSGKADKDPLFFCNVKSPTHSEDPASLEGEPKSSTSTFSRPWSRVTDIINFTVTEDHFVRAFEYSVLSAEYGNCLLVYSKWVPKLLCNRVFVPF